MLQLHTEKDAGTMNKYIFFTNIPTPYRTALYNELYEQGLNFEVYYMRCIEGDRSWQVDLSLLKHPYYIDNGYYKMMGRYHLHINPRLLYKLFKEKNTEVIIGGSWNDIDVLALAFFKRLGLFKQQLHFWSEANYLTTGASNDNILKRFLRKFVYQSSTGAQISSGKMTELTFEKWQIRVHAYLPLPNTIEEDKFQITAAEVAARQENPLPVFLLPVRLTETVKGIVNFFSALGDENIRRGRFLLAGDGPDKAMIEQFVASRSLGAHISLLGHCSTEKLASLYQSANVFVLPSFSDASPLTLVEALCMKLPLLVSNRCGNHFEGVEEGSNGYLFDPYEHVSIKLAFEEMMARQQDWSAMGEISSQRYWLIFSKKTAIRNFKEKLQEFSALA
ncbi:glycosyltransferase [Janthinobacterium sp. GW460P]|uniref:glycosyltransferase n=1 Tax=unclassified Janthinobacterium TaxID=2610881 RepID=UPI000A31E8A9|nr:MULTISPECIES: glycosyltransferase [unclassified Janthinobacterium]MCC7701854.1 glycosyltransferase [Janthinobacterium sp. GW460P]MCC7707362.1 glycosyltransferase [Janthinobacterium sp. GW460W]